GDRHRKIEWRDQARDTDWPAIAHGPLAAQLGGDRPSEQATPLTGGVVGRVDPFLDVAPRLREHLAHLASHAGGQLFLLPGEQVAQPAQQIAPRWRRHGPPRLESATG